MSGIHTGLLVFMGKCGWSELEADIEDVEMTKEDRDLMELD